MTLRRIAIVGAGLALGAVLGGRPAFADGPTYAQQLDEKAPALVTLKVVIASARGESTRQMPAAVIDPSGLVLCSAARLPAKPSSIQVLFGNDPTENPAVLVARDSVTSLAFLQVLDLPGGKPLAAVDLTKGSEVGVGQSLFGVSRLGRGFDYAPVIKRLLVTAKLETPRTLFDFEGDFGERGLPVFDLSGHPVGVISDQAAAGTEDKPEIFVWPLKDVLHAVDQAKTRIPDAVTKAKEKKDDAGEKPDEKKGGDDKDAKKPKGGEKPDPEKPGNGEKPAGPK